jgi:DnaJ homolog subfamily C member 17
MSQNDTPDFGDPYELLGLKDVIAGTTISDSDIQKAFRKQSLQYHPDKQGGKSEIEKIAIAQKFHHLHQAKEFLLDPKKREPYDTQRASRKRRQQHDQQREKQLTDRRRRMQQELAEREAKARGGDEGSQKRKQSMDTNIHRSQKRYETYSSSASSLPDDGWLQQLRKDGLRRREEFASKVETENRRRVQRQELANAFQIFQRQIRLKWSRKRISFSPNERSIATLLQSQFGTVEKVEILGSKGNQALITFESEDSCQPCIDFYSNHSEMRAFPLMVEDLEERSRSGQPQQPSVVAETDDEYAIRRSREREELQRQMEQDDEQDPNMVEVNSNTQGTKSITKIPFPLEFPSIENDSIMSPFDKLEYFEKLIWRKLQSPN